MVCGVGAVFEREWRRQDSPTRGDRAKPLFNGLTINWVIKEANPQHQVDRQKVNTRSRLHVTRA